jgi:glycosyltransferase involved in cell wall biosynthesis
MYLQSPGHFFRVVWNIVKLVKKYRISLIRSQDPFWMGLFGYLAARICRIHFCVSIHADYDHIRELGNKSRMVPSIGSFDMAKHLMRFILPKADMVFPIRETLAIKAIQNGSDPEKVRVIPHGIDLSPFSLPPVHNIFNRFGIDPAMKIISFAGRLSPENYVDDMLDIAKKLGKKRHDFMIVMAGGGKDEERLKNKIAGDSSLSKHIILVGFQPRDVCLDLRRASTVSLCLMAGFSLIEACAAGRPVISYDVAWHSELVQSNKTGFLLKEHDIDAVVEALDLLLENPSESDAMGERAKTMAFERHNLKNTSAIKVRAYSELLEKGQVH